MANLDQYALITLQDAKDHLRITSNDYDDLLIRFINAASAKIESWLDRKVKSRSYTEIQDGRRGSRLIVSQWPIISVSELRTSSSQDWSSSTSLVPSSDYFIDGPIGKEFEIVLKSGFFPRGRGNIRVIYTAGYATVPYDIQEACLWTVEFFYDMRSDRRIGISSKGKNGERTSFNPDLPEFVFSMIERYRREDFYSETLIENG